MGISSHEAKALIQLYRKAGPFGRMGTLGRQELYIHTAHIRRLLDGVKSNLHSFNMAEFSDDLSADAFFRLLGATEVVSFDASDYEKASIVHDMNLPIPSQFRESFDLVYDGGTLEHVFNFPQAVKNCMDLLRPSGLFVSATPSNNFMGHGFYQFSPELFFRLFGRGNGFRIEQMLAFEYEKGGRWFEVKDPGELGRRAELWGTRSRIILWVVARKVETMDGSLPSYPQQSDYVSQWDTKGRDLPIKVRNLDQLRRALCTYIEQLCPEAVDYFNYFRDRRHLRRANRKGLRLDSQGFRRLT